MSPPNIISTVNSLLLFAQWTCVILVSCILFLYFKSENNSSEFLITECDENDSSDTIKIHPIEAGIKGWLKFLVAILIIGPILSVALNYSSIISYEELYPAIKNIKEWELYTNFTWITLFVFSGLSVYAGLVLAEDRDKSAPKKVQALLWVIYPGSSFVCQFLVPSIIFSNLSVKMDHSRALGSFISGLFWASAWSLYIYKSKRIKATYTLD